MNDQALFLALAKAVESLDKLKAASSAVETLTMIETCPVAKTRLQTMLDTIVRETRDMERYTIHLRSS